MACGGSGTGNIDARVDAPSGADAVVLGPDARLFDAAPLPPDARLFDAAPLPPDARLFDAAPLPPDAPTTDAPPPCVSDDECVGAGVICVDDDTEVTCVQIQPGCFQVDEESEDDCGPNQACEDGSGCECVANPACAAAGEFCTEAGIVTCTADADGCLIDSDPVACPDPTVCDPDAGGANAAECVCPAVGTEENTGCQGTPVNTITCSADDSDVVRCELVGEAQCQVWRSLDNCAADGLECSQNDCVCPDNTEGDRFFANPVVDRSERPPELIIPTGVRDPAICSFEEMSTAIAFAIEFSGPNNIFDTYAVASNDDETADGADDPVARFEVEALPWPRIPDNVTVTTEDDAVVGGTGNLNNDNFVVVVNSHDPSLIEDVQQNANASVHISGRFNRLTTTRGGAVKGLTFLREPCRFTEDQDEGCQFPEIAIFIDGVSNPVGTAAKLPAHERPSLIAANARIDRVDVDGSSNGELDLARVGDEDDCLDPDDEPTDPVSGIFTGGAITSPTPDNLNEDSFPDTFMFRAPPALSAEPCFDEDGIFDDVHAGDWFHIASGPNAGTYYIEDIRRSAEFFLAGRDEDDILILRGTGTSQSDVTGEWSVRSNSVGQSADPFDGDCGPTDDIGCDGSWRFGVVNTGSGIFNQLGVFNFASAAPTDHGRAGVLQVGNTGDQEEDPEDYNDDDVAVWTALTLDFNDVGYVHDNGRAWISSGLFGDQRSVVTNSNGMGVFVEEGILDVEHLTVTGTRGGFGISNGPALPPEINNLAKAPVVPLFPNNWDGDGDGIRLVNWDLTQTTWNDVISTQNSRHGAYVGNNASNSTSSGELLCYNDRGWDGINDYGATETLTSGYFGPCEDFNDIKGPGVDILHESGFVDWSGAQLSGNFVNGLSITDYGTVVQNGGDISDNGVFGIGMFGYSVFNAGSATVGDGTDALHVENNGVGGLFNVRGEANLRDTVFTNNGTLNLCSVIIDPADLEDEDMRGPAIFIGKVFDDSDEGTLHAINIEVVDNNGAGIVINSTGNDNYEPRTVPVWSYPQFAGKLPAADEADARRNTIEDSLVDGNLGIGGFNGAGTADTGCAGFFGPAFLRWPNSGVEVWNDGVLHAANGQSSSRGNAVNITNNSKGGLWVSGVYVPSAPGTRVTDPPGTPPVINEGPAPTIIEGNGWTGATVWKRDLAVLTLGAGSRINNNGHATGAATRDANNDGLFVMGGTTSLTGVEVSENFDDGVYVNTPADLAAVNTTSGHDPFYTPSDTRVTLDSLEVRANGDDGMYLVGAPGALGVVEGTTNTTVQDNYAGTLMDVDPRPEGTFTEYGVVILNPTTVVTENGGDGIHIGTNGASQNMNVTVWMDRGEIFLNDGVGIRAVQDPDYNANTGECASDEGVDSDLDDDGFNDAVDADDDGDGVLDGADTSTTDKATEHGCTGVTIHGMKIFDNILEGFYLNGAYVVPRTIEQADQFTHYGVGFTSNEVYHNAIGDGCASAQSRPQVMVEGPAPQDPEICSAFGTQMLCQNNSDGVPATEINFHCFWTGTSCNPIYDLRGSLTCDPQVTGNANAIHSYNTTTDQSEYSVGMYAETGAFVWADNNRWREPVSNFTDNVDQASGAFVDADSNCGGSELNCVEGPTP